MYENLIIQKSPLFTLRDVHYLCAENEEIKFLLDYRFEKADPLASQIISLLKFKNRSENSEILITLLQSSLMNLS